MIGGSTDPEGLVIEVGKAFLNERLKHVMCNRGYRILDTFHFHAKTLKSSTSWFPLITQVNGLCSCLLSLNKLT